MVQGDIGNILFYFMQYICTLEIMIKYNYFAGRLDFTLPRVAVKEGRNSREKKNLKIIQLYRFLKCLLENKAKRVETTCYFL